MDKTDKKIINIKENAMDYLVPGTRKTKLEKIFKATYHDASEWEPWDRSRYYRSNLSENDYKFLAYYLGIKKDDKIIIQKGKDATRTEKVNLRDLPNISSNRLKVTTGDYFNENTGDFYEDFVFSEEVVTLDSKINRKFLDTTQNNIKFVPGLVIDLDNHDSGIDNERASMLASQLDFFLTEDYNLKPHYINFTGRGLQVFFAVNEYDPSNDVVFELAKDTYKLIQDAIQEILDLIQKGLPTNEKVWIDKGLSLKRQFIRLPGFINWNSGYVAQNIVCNHAMTRYNLGDMIYQLKHNLGIKPTGKKWVNFSSNKSKNFDKEKAIRSYKQKEKLLENRIHDDILLLKHRGNGSRHNAYTNMTISLMSMYKTDKEVSEYLSSVDKDIGYFKTSHQLSNFVDNMREYFNSRQVNGIYKLTNKTIEDTHYGITDEEFLILPFETYGKAKNVELHWEKRRVNKLRMQTQLIKSYVEQLITNTRNISKLSRDFGIASRTTVYSYINKFEDTINELLLNVFMESIKNNKEFQVINNEEAKERLTQALISKGNESYVVTNKAIELPYDDIIMNGWIDNESPSIYNLNIEFLNTYCDSRIKNRLNEKFKYHKPPKLSNIIDKIKDFIYSLKLSNEKSKFISVNLTV